jgi:hypothetical protein
MTTGVENGTTGPDVGHSGGQESLLTKVSQEDQVSQEALTHNDPPTCRTDVAEVYVP